MPQLETTLNVYLNANGQLVTSLSAALNNLKPRYRNLETTLNLPIQTLNQIIEAT